MRKGYVLRVHETIGGESKQVREYTFDDSKTARDAFEEATQNVYDDLNTTYMRNIGGFTDVFLNGYDEETGGELMLLHGDVRRPLHSPEALAFVREAGQQARKWEAK